MKRRRCLFLNPARGAIHQREDAAKSAEDQLGLTRLGCENFFAAPGQDASLGAREALEASARNFFEQRINFLDHELFGIHLLVTFVRRTALRDDSLQD